MRHLLPLLLACLLAPSIVPVYSEGEEGTIDTETAEQTTEGEEGTIDTETAEQTTANEGPTTEDSQTEEASPDDASAETADAESADASGGDEPAGDTGKGDDAADAPLTEEELEEIKMEKMLEEDSKCKGMDVCDADRPCPDGQSCNEDGCCELPYQCVTRELAQKKKKNKGARAFCDAYKACGATVPDIPLERSKKRSDEPFATYKELCSYYDCISVEFPQYNEKLKLYPTAEQAVKCYQQANVTLCEDRHRRATKNVFKSLRLKCSLGIASQDCTHINFNSECQSAIKDITKVLTYKEFSDCVYWGRGSGTLTDKQHKTYDLLYKCSEERKKQEKKWKRDYKKRMREKKDREEEKRIETVDFDGTEFNFIPGPTDISTFLAEAERLAAELEAEAKRNEEKRLAAEKAKLELEELQRKAKEEIAAELQEEEEADESQDAPPSDDDEAPKEDAADGGATDGAGDDAQSDGQAEDQGGAADSDANTEAEADEQQPDADPEQEATGTEDATGAEEPPDDASAGDGDDAPENKSEL